MESDTILIMCTHGTYGRHDDLYGGLLTANAALAKGLKVTIFFIEDGVFACNKNQNPSKIGLPNTIEELNDFLELGGRLIIDKISIDERGITMNDMIDGAEIIQIKDIDDIIKNHNVSLTF
jgi:sulfur relay (sulfurtransferase) DsrF/TusC family protein